MFYEYNVSRCATDFPLAFIEKKINTYRFVARVDFSHSTTMNNLNECPIKPMRPDVVMTITLPGHWMARDEKAIAATEPTWVPEIPR